MQKLSQYKVTNYTRGAGFLQQVLWIFVSFFVCSGIPGSSWRIFFLKRFGAIVGVGVVIKPRVRIKFPWKLAIGNYSWIGESVWIDNLDTVKIGSNVCISQGCYFCTGSHRWDRETFDLTTAQIVIHDGAWIAAFVRLAPGIVIGKDTVVTMGSVVTTDVHASTVVAVHGKQVFYSRPRSKTTGR